MGNEENEYLKRIYDLDIPIHYVPTVEVGHVVQPERLDPRWFYKRVSWQSVGDVMTGEDWITGLPGTKQHIADTIHKIVQNQPFDGPGDFMDRLRCYQWIAYHSLLDGDIS